MISDCVVGHWFSSLFLFLSYSVYLHYVRAREQIHQRYTSLRLTVPCYIRHLLFALWIAIGMLRFIFLDHWKQIHKGICRVSWELGYRGDKMILAVGLL
jgi:hypothetical protein